MNVILKYTNALYKCYHSLKLILVEIVNIKLNSSQYPEKDIIILQKQKRVKRKLNGSLINVHKKYVTESNFKVGYLTLPQVEAISYSSA